MDIAANLKAPLEAGHHAHLSKLLAHAEVDLLLRVGKIYADAAAEDCESKDELSRWRPGCHCRRGSGPSGKQLALALPMMSAIMHMSTMNALHTLMNSILYS